MSLSADLISQFVKATKDEEPAKKEATVLGTTVEYNGKMYVKLDGSDLLTPVSSTADTKADERVTVLIKNHTATVTGNMSSPSARTDDVKDVASQISEFEIIVAHRVTTEELTATIATIESLKATTSKLENIDAVYAEIETLEAMYTNTEYLTANEVEAINAQIEHIEAIFGEFTDISTEDLEAITADIGSLKAYTADFTYVSTEVLDAIKANIKQLETDKLSAKEAEIKYANIDFTNINQAAVEKIFSDSGIIEDLIVSDGKITGELVGVTIKGDLIEGNTIKADKLVVKGSDGLYYKLNLEAGVIESAEVTKEELQNGLHGTAIIAKTITAEKIAVDDLVAFGATIGGFHITDDAIYSGVKESATNTTRGVYLDNEGQLSVGDSNNYLRYFKDADGSYKLEISARSIKISTSDKTVEDAIADVEKAAITSTKVEFYKSTSPTSLSGGSWSTSQPTWTDGTYIWMRTLATYGDGFSEYTPSVNGVCITGNTGAEGDPGADGRTTYLHIKYSDDGETFTADDGETLGAWIGTRVDFNEIPSTTFSDYIWKKFTEDVDEELDSIRESITENYEASIEASETILATALGEYVKTTDYDQFKSNTEASLQVAHDEMTIKFEETNVYTHNLNGELNTFMETFSKYIKLAGDNAIIIGSGDSSITLEIDNESGITFKRNGVPFGFWDGEDFHTGNIVIDVSERAQFGNFAYVPRKDGSLSFLKVENRTGIYAILSGGLMRIYGAYPTLEGTTMVISDASGILNGTTLEIGG